MIVAGLGFASAATLVSLTDAFERAARGHAVAAIATVADKDGHPALAAFAAARGLPVQLVPPADLAGQRTLTCSLQSRAAYGTGSVAEASALAAAGPGGRLLCPRQISDDRLATCAVAIGGQT
ncbi:cobalamin biosynthesis protein [Ruegeria marina]|uniref:Cobalt-precorrin 5A hydrolase n=1 Tax=Ruegeria marina TaxID=639004 RepID=A0A1G6L2K9_9RHOB|nr:cobalamin biosynthesis protein [Ruegeria marina]SDC37414.1 cobalt-precorrin 5A hydrolase [Ruegeria marina]